MNTMRTLFKDVQTLPMREGLENEILQAVLAVRDSQLRYRLAVSYVGLFFSGVAVFYASFSYGGTFLGSEFWSIITLIFSDALVVVNYWNEFSFLLLETVPVIPILLMLVPSFIFLMFLSMYFGTTRQRHYSY